MTPLGWIVAAALVAVWLVNLAVDRLNLWTLDGEVPAELEGAVDDATWSRTGDYVRARTRLSWWSGALELAALLVFWLAGGFGWLDGWARGLGLGAVATGLIFFAVLGLASWALGLPAGWASTFGVEARFGFNRQTPKGWWGDALKGVLVGALVGGPLLALLLWVFERLGTHAWLWAWGLVAAWMLAVQYVAPRWILPLFMKFQPLEDGELRGRLESLAETTSFPLGEVSVVDASKRSTKANAFFTGMGKRKRIALFDTLVEKHPAAEVELVLAHEIGHWSLGHIWRGTVLSVLQLGAFLALFGWVQRQPAALEAFGFETASTHGALVAFSILTGPLGLVLGLLFSWMSRRHEYQADGFAREATGRPEDLVSALTRLSQDSLAHLAPHPAWVALNASHPPLAARISALRRGVIRAYFRFTRS